MRQVLLSQLDPALPSRPFGKWFEQMVGASAGVSWQLHDCGDADREGGDLAACIEVTAIISNERMVIVTAQVGTFKQGLSGAPRLRLVAIEDFGQIRRVARLGELPVVLRQPPIRAARPVSRVARLPPASPARSPRLVYAGPPPPELPPVRSVADPLPAPPPQTRPASLRVSEGALLASAVTRVVPIYPAIARQISASGEVKVQVTIGDDGKVIEAAAISGHPLLRQAAEVAARRWTFKPAMFNGQPIVSQGTLSFLFEKP
jgi:TonB family protein